MLSFLYLNFLFLKKNKIIKLILKDFLIQCSKKKIIVKKKIILFKKNYCLKKF